MPAKLISDYLKVGEGVGQLMPQTATLLHLRQLAREALPKNLLRSCEIANYKQGTVIIFAENNAVAAKLRLFGPQLIAQLSQRGLQVTAIKVQVQAAEPMTRALTGKRAQLPAAARLPLEQLGQSLPDGALRSAIRSLAKKARER